MTDFLITHSYFQAYDPKQEKLSKPYPPLATLILASVIRIKNFTVSFHDSMFKENHHEIFREFEICKPKYFLIAEDGFNYLTKMCLSNMRDATFEMLQKSKEKYQTLNIVSSSDATDHYEKYLAAGADIIIAGEAEETMEELLSSISNPEKWENIQGIIFLKDGNIIKNNKRPVTNVPDKIPFPAWDLLNIKPYLAAWKKHGYFSMNIATTRGCPFKCNWCAKPIYGNRYNSRSPENVVSEMEIMMKLFSPQHFWMCDDIFGLKPGWVNEFSGLLKNKKIKVKYKIQSRADLLQDELTVSALAESGCEEVWIGAESGSQKILDAMDKGITLEEIRNAVTLLKKHGIKPCLFIQFGYLGETKSDIEATLKMVDELQPYDIGVSVSYPLPGTVFYEKVKTRMGSKSNWTDSDELAVMYNATFDSEFYKSLHRYIHKRFRASQGKRFFKGEKNFGRQALLLPYFYFSAAMYRSRMNKFKTNKV